MPTIQKTFPSGNVVTIEPLDETGSKDMRDIGAFSIHSFHPDHAGQPINVRYLRCYVNTRTICEIELADSSPGPATFTLDEFRLLCENGFDISRNVKG